MKSSLSCTQKCHYCNVMTKMKLKWLESHNRCVVRLRYSSSAMRGHMKSVTSNPLAVHMDARTHFQIDQKPVGIPRSVCYNCPLYGRHTPHKFMFWHHFFAKFYFQFHHTMLPLVESNPYIYGFVVRIYRTFRENGRQLDVYELNATRICRWFVQPVKSMRITHIRFALVRSCGSRERPNII